MCALSQVNSECTTGICDCIVVAKVPNLVYDGAACKEAELGNVALPAPAWRHINTPHPMLKSPKKAL